MADEKQPGVVIAQLVVVADAEVIKAADIAAEQSSKE